MTPASHTLTNTHHPNSKILISKQKIIDLFPRIEKTLESIKDADNTVMQMQIKRQREFWHLLKIACVSGPESPWHWTSRDHPALSLCVPCPPLHLQAQNSSRNSIAASPESSNLLQVSQWSQSAQPVSSPHPLTSLPGPNDRYRPHPQTPMCLHVTFPHTMFTLYRI